MVRLVRILRPNCVWHRSKDPTINELQKQVAKLFGKEAASGRPSVRASQRQCHRQCYVAR